MAVSEDAQKIRRTYGRGLIDGLRAAGVANAEEIMNSARMKSIEAGLTGIARKVLDAVSETEPRTVTQIITPMRRGTGAYPDKHIVEGCLASLIDSRMIRGSGSDAFLRIPMKTEPVLVSVSAASTSAPVPTPTPVPAAEPPSTMDRLAQLAATLRVLASEAENIALDIESQIQKAQVDIGKLRQLQELLKGL